jgi:hypothetical protein
VLTDVGLMLPVYPDLAVLHHVTEASVSVGMAGLGLAGQDGSGRVAQCVTHEAIGPPRWCLSVELSARGGAAGTIRPTSVT